MGENLKPVCRGFPTAGRPFVACILRMRSDGTPSRSPPHGGAPLVFVPAVRRLVPRISPCPLSTLPYAHPFRRFCHPFVGFVSLSGTRGACHVFLVQYAAPSCLYKRERDAPRESFSSCRASRIYYDYEITRMRFRRRYLRRTLFIACFALIIKKRIPEHVRESWPTPSPRSPSHGFSGHREHASGTGRQTNRFPCLPYCVAARYGFHVSLLFASMLPGFARKACLSGKFVGSLWRMAPSFCFYASSYDMSPFMLMPVPSLPMATVVQPMRFIL